jgi:hypothetical protein
MIIQAVSAGLIPEAPCASAGVAPLATHSKTVLPKKQPRNALVIMIVPVEAQLSCPP